MIRQVAVLESGQTHGAGDGGTLVLRKAGSQIPFVHALLRQRNRLGHEITQQREIARPGSQRLAIAPVDGPVPGVLENHVLGDDTALASGAKQRFEVIALPHVDDVQHLVEPVLGSILECGQVRGRVQVGAIGLHEHEQRELLRVLGTLDVDDDRALVLEGDTVFEQPGHERSDAIVHGGLAVPPLE